MQVIENENNVFCDVDDTLVMWDSPLTPGPNKIRISYADNKVFLTPHEYHIALVKMYKERGYRTTVWSANGYRHAVQVVEALGLEDYVDQVMSKPQKYMDDSTAESALGARVYCKDFLSGNTEISK